MILTIHIGKAALIGEMKTMTVTMIVMMDSGYRVNNQLFRFITKTRSVSRQNHQDTLFYF